jgi:uncharacterized protein (TIGR03663 family)
MLDNNMRRRSRITVEMALWAAVGVLALVLRLANLGAAPLAAHEVREAMFAWRAVTGQGMPEAGYSPFLFVANSILFALCGAGDALARLWPALLGSAFALTPLLFRRRVGRAGVLAAGLYLAISPTALFASRQLDGAVVVALGGALLLGGGLRFLETGNRNWLILAAVGLALAMASGSSIYGMGLTLGLASLFFAWGWPAGRLRRLAGLITPQLGIVLATFVLAVFVFATGLGWNLPGVGAAADLLPAWFARLGGLSLLPLADFVLYEPLPLLIALGGLVLAVLFKSVWLVQQWLIRRKQRTGMLSGLASLARWWRDCWRRRIGTLVGLWIGVGFGMLIVMPPESPVDAVWLVLPLALFSGFAVEAAVQNWRAVTKWRAEWVYVFITSALWVYLYLRFSRYGLMGDPLDLVVGIMALVFPLLLLALAALIFALISGDDRVVTAEIIGGARSALHGAMLSTAGVLLAITFSAGWGVAHVRPTDPRELLVYEPTALEVRDLVQTLRGLSWRETGLPTTLEFTYEAAPDSVLAWYLRDFSAARRVDDLREVDLWEWGAAVVTLDRGWVPESPEASEALAGQDFVLSRSWRIDKVSCIWEWPPCNEAVEWLIRRDPALADWSEWAALEPEADRWVVVWTYADDIESALQ